MQNIKSAKSLFRKAKKFWISERYEGLDQKKGVIIFIHPKGKVGKIKSQEGHVYNFHKRDFNRKQSYLSTLKNAEVVFVVMNDIDNKQVAENIKVLKTEKSTTPNQFKLGALKTGTIKNFADFGIFVKLNEKEDGLLHKNRLPNHLKETFKMEFTPGQNIKVEIIKVTEKGPELKLAE
jgi:ribosomal protein S1